MEKKEKKKDLYSYKLGEMAPITDKMLKDLMQSDEMKLVKIGYTYQGKNGVQMECALKHKDYIEDKEED